MSTDSQRLRILAHLKKGKTLTALQAFLDFDCLRLSGRIKELRQEGHDVETTMINVSGKKVARYSLPK